MPPRPDAKVLLFGATGFLGGNIAHALADAGRHVRALTRAPAGAYVPAMDMEWVHGDLRHPSSLAASFVGVEEVIHAAGHYPTVSLDRDAVMRRGVAEMRNVLSAARDAHVKRLVYVSSLSTIAPSSSPLRLSDERDFYHPGTVRDAYFDVKYAMEMEAYRFVAQEGLDVVVVNPTIVLGPGDVKPTSGALLVNLAKGRVPALIDANINVVSARAVAAATVAALVKGRAGQRYVIGGENTTFAAVVREAAKLLGVEAPTTHVPFAVARAASLASEVAAKFVTKKPPMLPLEFVDILQHARHVSSEKARRDLALPDTRVTELLAESIAWFREAGKI